MISGTMSSFFSRRSFRVGSLLGLGGAVFSFLAVVVSTVLLETFALRKTVDGGSLNTMFPGFVYACVAIMKIMLVAAPIYIVAGFFSGIRNEDQAASPYPTCSIRALSICVLVPVIGAISILLAQNIYLENFAHTSQFAVTVMFCMILAAVVVGVVGVVKKETPRTLSFLTLLVTVTIALTFVWFEFYKFGFDQDRWNNI